MKTLFVSLEMSAASLWAKAACGALGVSWTDVKAGSVPPDTIDAIAVQAGELAETYGRYLLVDDGANTTETIRDNIDKFKPDLVVVDHLRLVGNRDESEVKRLGTITQRAKDLAKFYNCGMVVLAQLNRGVENREEKRPSLADLRDSGQIEENADLVLMMYRPDYYDPPAIPTPASATEILIPKFRDGEAGRKIHLAFDKKHQFFGAPYELNQ